MVLDKELIAWKREQQLAGNGLQMSLSLETLQEWCESLAAIIWSMRQQIKQLENLRTQLTDPTNTPNHIPDLLSGITDLLSNLVTGTFIIEKQPPQVRHNFGSKEVKMVININPFFVPGDENQHSFHRHRPPAGGRSAQRPHG